MLLLSQIADVVSICFHRRILLVMNCLSGVPGSFVIAVGLQAARRKELFFYFLNCKYSLLLLLLFSSKQNKYFTFPFHFPKAEEMRDTELPNTCPRSSALWGRDASVLKGKKAETTSQNYIFSP